MTRAPLASPSLLEVTELEVPPRVEDWLARLPDLTWLRLAGRDPGRVRIVSALLHGNEPSSVRAVHRWLLARRPPATELWLMLGAVRAARTPPVFSHRFLPEDGDLNRCWLPPFRTARAWRARDLLDRLVDSGAEALIDLHNNSGHNPPYGVGPRDDASVLGLVSLFGERFVHSPLRLGTLVEATAPRFPSVTIECGRAGDPAADEVAYTGLCHFLDLDALASLESRTARIQRLGDPIRVTVRPGARLRFDTKPCSDAELTLDPAIDRHNFQLLDPDVPLGWLSGEGIPLLAHDAAGVDRTLDLFRTEGAELRVARPWVPVMMTTSPAAALADCLFYAVRPRGDA